MTGFGPQVQGRKKGVQSGQAGARSTGIRYTIRFPSEEAGKISKAKRSETDHIMHIEERKEIARGCQ